MTWRAHLPEMLATGTFETQDEIVRALETMGFRVDQAAISRELRIQGAVKRGGAYRLTTPQRKVPIHVFQATAAGCLAVVRTDPAYAHVLAQSIDAAELDGILGTIAGDDTVFVAASGPDATGRLAAFLGMRTQSSGAGPQ
jgi:transcriptional regulator of arginine metabolism